MNDRAGCTRPLAKDLHHTRDPGVTTTLKHSDGAGPENERGRQTLEATLQ